jgi:hypothetical protein
MKITYSREASWALAELTLPVSKQWDVHCRLLGYDPMTRANEVWTARTLRAALRDMFSGTDRWAYSDH